MRRRPTQAFTLIELIIVVTISSVVVMAVSLFLQKSITLFKRTDETAELASRIKFAAERLRECVRHSISSLSNFQNTHTAFEATETLFFITDFDQNGVREMHFVWYDRYHSTANASGTNKLLHVWQRANLMVAAGVAGTTPMPPNMTDASFTSLINYLRIESNFNLAADYGQPSVEHGWEVLIDAPYPDPRYRPTTQLSPSAQIPRIYMGRWKLPSAMTYPTDSNGRTVPPPGIAFNVGSLLRINPAANPTYSSVLTNATPQILWDLCINGSGPYIQTASGLGSPHCQVFFNLYIDSNENGSVNGDSLPDTDETHVQFLTSLNVLFIPSTGRSTGP